MWHKYTDLTDSMILKIARLCNQEQGNLNGVRAEASLMANQLETDPSRTNMSAILLTTTSPSARP